MYLLICACVPRLRGAGWGGGGGRGGGSATHPMTTTYENCHAVSCSLSYRHLEPTKGSLPRLIGPLGAIRCLLGTSGAYWSLLVWVGSPWCGSPPSRLEGVVLFLANYTGGAHSGLRDCQIGT